METTRYSPMSSGKRAAVAGLFALAVLIILAGVAFGVYSAVYNVSYTVLNSPMPGWVFASVVVFLGVRYFLSVIRMRKRLAETNAAFSWSNFKPEKVIKNRRRNKI